MHGPHCGAARLWQRAHRAAAQLLHGQQSHHGITPQTTALSSYNGGSKDALGDEGSGDTVDIGSYRKTEESAIVHCPARKQCPLAPLCGPDAGDGKSQDVLFPTCTPVEPGEVIWVDLRYEQRVFALRSGLFSCVANLEQDEELPFALYGSCDVIGLSELYIARAVSSTYYLKALTPGLICSFPGRAVKRVLEDAPHRFLSAC